MGQSHLQHACLSASFQSFIIPLGYLLQFSPKRRGRLISSQLRFLFVCFLLFKHSSAVVLLLVFGEPYRILSIESGGATCNQVPYSSNYLSLQPLLKKYTMMEFAHRENLNKLRNIHRVHWKRKI